MISLEELADGSLTDRNFQKLMSLVPDTGGRSMFMRKVSGVVDGPTGNAISGVGFTPARSSTGVYTITYETAFPGVPSVVVTVADLGVVDRAYATSTSTVATVHIKDPGVAFHDVDFSFQAEYLA